MTAAAVQQDLQHALAQHQAGQTDQAERGYRRVLAVKSDHPDALNLLGLLCLSSGRTDEARRLLERAVAVSPQTALFHLHLGNARQASGLTADAIESWRRAAALAPDLVDAKLNLAAALTGAAASGAADRAAAMQAWRDVVQVAPDSAEAHFHLGQLLASARRFDEAAQSLGACVRLDPSRFVAHNALGATLSELGDHEQAAAAFERATQLSPATAPFHANLGHALRAADRPDHAERAFRRAVELGESVLGAAYHGLAASLRDLERLPQAHAAAARAVEISPDFAPGYHNLGNIQYDLGLMDDAVTSLRKSLSLNPRDAKVHAALLLMLHYRHGHETQLMFAEHRRWGELHADPLTAAAALAATGRAADSPTSPSNGAPSRRKPRIGYVSADLCAHPVAFFLQPLLEAHDRDAFEFTIYSSTRRADDWTKLLRDPRDTWRDVRGLSDEALCELVRRDGIDILVDLSGHIAGNRLLAFARRPAPVQVTYLGYPDTTGMRAIDYRLTDAWHDPPGETDAFHTERLVRLPGGAWCFRPRDAMPDVSTPPADANGFVTFLSPNKVAKVTDAMLEAWRCVLARVPGSRLIALTGGDEAGARRVRAALGGIDDARVELVPRTSTREYFNLYARADVVLDTFPYNGHTTSCDALWMGLPVVTLAGQTHVTRAGLSLLSKLGLERFVADNVDGYVERAVRAANDREELRELRRTMRDRVRARGLTDGTRVAREIEEAYRAMWRTWCAG